MTSGQRDILTRLTGGPRSASELAEHYPLTYDHTHSQLRRLEDHGLVRRTGAKNTRGQLWELTQTGRTQLELTA